MQAEELLQTAILAIQNGDKARAIGLLRRLLEQQPRNAEAWYWLSKTQDDRARRRECLVRALRFQPTHDRARAELAALEARPLPPSTPTQPARGQSLALFRLSLDFNLSRSEFPNRLNGVPRQRVSGLL